MNDAEAIKMFGKGLLGIVIIFVVLSLIFGSWYSVGEGEVGVKFSKYGKEKGFSPNELSQGWGFKMPFRDRIITMPFRTQEIAFFGNAEARNTYSKIIPKDKNGINFDVDMTVRYQIDPSQASEFVEQKGAGLVAMEQLLATAARADSTRGVFGKYAQEDVPEERIKIALEIKDVLQQRINQEATGKLKPNFIIIEAVDVRNIAFNPKIEAAIIEKQTQKQVAERKEYELEQAVKDKEIAIVNANKTKEAKILVAQGEAQAVLVLATAKAEGIQKVNDAYQDMPLEYVQVKYAEAIKPTDKVYFGFDSLGGNTMGFLNYNDVAGLYSQGQTSSGN